MDARLTLLHVLARDGDHAAHNLAEKHLQEQVKSLAVPSGSIRALEVRAGELENTIAEVGLRTRAQLIVMGAPRKRTLASLRGTTPERVLALSPYQGPLYAEGYDLKAARRHIAQWKRRAREYVLEKLKTAGVRPAHFDVQIEERRALALVREALGRGASSLLILGGSEHTVFSRLARGSLANDALRRLDCDVLIYAGA
jgi:nucleotide-binding universal stress UspA family protein